jgi:hypothetical protein
MKPEQEKVFMDLIKERSTAIGDRSFVLEKWADYCETQRNKYYSLLCGFNNVLRMVNRTGILTKFFTSFADLPAVVDVIRCESHREALLSILEDDLRRRKR